MCRNIRTLFNFEPPATDQEIRASALQFVRKLSGFTHPSRANAAAFERAVDEVTETARRLLAALETASPAKNREAEAMKARARARQRFAEDGRHECCDRLFAPRLPALVWLQLMNRRGYAGAAPQRLFQVDRAAVLSQQIAEGLVGQFLKVLHLVAA